MEGQLSSSCSRPFGNILLSGLSNQCLTEITALDFHYWWKNALQKFIIQDILSFKTCRLFHFTHYLFHLINNFDFIKRVLHQLVKSVAFIAKEKQRKLSIKALACIQHTALTFSSLVCVMVIKTQRKILRKNKTHLLPFRCLYDGINIAHINTEIFYHFPVRIQPGRHLWMRTVKLNCNRWHIYHLPLKIYLQS